MKNKIDFYTQEYSPAHWSINFTGAGTSIATIIVRNRYYFSVILNPSDCQGYRSIIRYLNEEGYSLSSTFNRTYTLSEQRALNDLVSLMTKIYEKIGVIPQFAQLGNNSHRFDPESRTTTIGNDEEPSLLHAHIWGRGDPQMEYIPGVPLRGPEPGLMFDLRTKKPFDKEELQTCLSTFKRLLADYVKSSEFLDEFGSSIKVFFDDPKIEDLSIKEKSSSGFSFFPPPILAYTCDFEPSVAASSVLPESSTTP